MRAIPTLHEVDFGESVTWVPPAGAARYHVWVKTDSHTWFDDRDPSDMTYGGNSPRWAQVAGFDVANAASSRLPRGRGGKAVRTEYRADRSRHRGRLADNALAVRRARPGGADGHGADPGRQGHEPSTGSACRHRTAPTRAPSPRRNGGYFRHCSTAGRRSRPAAARRRSCRPRAKGTS